MKVMPADKIAAFLAPVAEEIGVEIVEVKWNARESSLTLFIDAPQGVDLDLCEKFHRAVDAPLDELDPTYGCPYTLNCSSAGLDRPFRDKRDYDRHLGEKVELHLYAPLFGAKYHEGVLLGYDEGVVRIQTEEGELSFSSDKIAKACLFIDI